MKPEPCSAVSRRTTGQPRAICHSSTQRHCHVTPSNTRTPAYLTKRLTLWPVDLLSSWSTRNVDIRSDRQKKSAQAKFESTVAEAQAAYKERWRGLGVLWGNVSSEEVRREMGTEAELQAEAVTEWYALLPRGSRPQSS